jgi:hypothetical protein
MDKTFLEGVTDKNTGQSIFRLKELTWFTYKVSCVMCSVSSCEDFWSIEGWIHSKWKNRLSQELVESLLHTHTNLVLRKSLDVVLHHLLSWDIKLTIHHPNRRPRFVRQINSLFFLLIRLNRCVTSSY